MTDGPYIWTRRPKIIEPRRELVLPFRMRGWFKIEAGKRDGRRRLLADWFPNLIVNAGLNGMAADAAWMEECLVGSGTDAPANGDTGLQTEVASTTTLQARSLNAESEEPYFGSVTSTYRFGEGVAEGNLSEVGIGKEDGFLFSRARILDGADNPTTITVLSDEFLDVTYQMRCYPPLVDVVDEIDFGGSDLVRNYTMRAARVTDVDYWSIVRATNLSGTGRQDGSAPVIDSGAQVFARDGAIAAITSFPSGTSDTATSVTPQAYTNDNFFRDTLCTFGLNDGNFGGGVLSIEFHLGDYLGTTVGGQWGRLGAYQCGFDTALPKDNTKILAVTFRAAWDRATI